MKIEYSNNNILAMSATLVEIVNFSGHAVAILAGQRTCDSQVAGSSKTYWLGSTV